MHLHVSLPIRPEHQFQQGADVTVDNLLAAAVRENISVVADLSKATKVSFEVPAIPYSSLHGIAATLIGFPFYLANLTDEQLTCESSRDLVKQISGMVKPLIDSDHMLLWRWLCSQSPDATPMGRWQAYMATKPPREESAKILKEINELPEQSDPVLTALLTSHGIPESVPVADPEKLTTAHQGVMWVLESSDLTVLFDPTVEVPSSMVEWATSVSRQRLQPHEQLMVDLITVRRNTDRVKLARNLVAVETAQTLRAEE